MKSNVVCRLPFLLIYFTVQLVIPQKEDKSEEKYGSINSTVPNQRLDQVFGKKNANNSSPFQSLHLNFTINNACSQNLSCAQRSCPNRLSFTNEFPGCYCDSYCESFQDCCYDYSSTCNTSKSKKNSTKIKEDLLWPWFCVSLGRTSYWMKNKCSKSWPHDEVESLCVNLQSRFNSSTYLDFVPVLGVQDNITYRNRHCARCNYQDNFDFWKIRASLSFQPVGVRTIGNLIDFLLKFEDKGSNVFVPASEMPRRYCLKPVSNCSSSMSEKVYHKCAHGDVALVVGEHLYRNKHCASCNGEESVTCGPNVTKETNPILKFADFYLTINFRHRAQSSGYSINYLCPKRVYDHHLKACVDPEDIVAPIDTVLDKYKIAIWFYSTYSMGNMSNITHLQNCFTDVEPGNIFNAKLKNVQKGIHMVTFDVQLTLNQSIELLKNYSEVKQDSATTSYSIVKFIKPFTKQFSLLLDGKIVEVIKTTSRQLGCVGLQVFNASDYTKLEHGKIYVHTTKRNYSRDQYFKVNSSEGLVKVCEKQLPNDCAGFYVEYNEGEFEVRTNLSLFHKVRGELYQFGEYTLQKNKVYICHIALQDSTDTIREYLTIIGLFLSIFCSVLVLITYIIFSQLRTLPGKNIINLMVGLIMLDLVWLVSPQAVRIGPLCTVTAFVIQFFMLFVHISMAKIAHDTLSMFSDPIAYQRKGSTSQTKSFLIVWSIPLVLVVSCFILYYCSVLDIQFTKNCWLSGKHVFAIVYIPVCLVIAFNIIWFTRSILTMRKQEKNRQILRAQKQELSSCAIVERKRLVVVHIKISTVVGLGWASAFVAVLFPVFSYVFVILTTFQGVYIFLAFVCKRNVLTLWKNLFRLKAKQPNLVQSETRV